MENNCESNLEPLCSLLGEKGCWMAMTKAAYGANQRSLAPQWHPSRWIGAPVATINQTCRKAPVPAAKPHAPSRWAVRNAAERGNVERMEHSEQARPRLRRSNVGQKEGAEEARARPGRQHAVTCKHAEQMGRQRAVTCD